MTDDQKNIQALMDTVNAHRDKISWLEKVVRIQGNSIATQQNQIQQMNISFANATAVMGHGSTVKEDG